MLGHRLETDRRSAQSLAVVLSGAAAVAVFVLAVRQVITQGENQFFACTGVTDGDLLQGVRYEGPRGATTESLVTRSRSGTVRRIMARHDREKLRQLVGDLRLG